MNNNVKKLQAFTFSAFNTLTLSWDIHDSWVAETQRVENLLLEHAAGGEVPKVRECMTYLNQLWAIKQLYEDVSRISAESLLDNWTAEVQDIPD
jgi:hypothetical protein